MALTDEAKNELREAIRIVREDRFEQYVRTVVKPKDPPKDPPNDPPPDPNLPPKKEDDPPDGPPKGRRSAYWGELMDDGD